MQYLEAERLLAALVVNVEGLDDRTVGEIRVAVSQIIESATNRQAWPGGWTPEAASELVRRLNAAGRDIQGRVITAAAQSGGFVSREQTYALAEYPEGRSLKGFSRPVIRIVDELVADGQLAAGAMVPLHAEYDSANLSFQRTIGFRIPAELVPTFQEALATLDGVPR